MTRRLFRSNFIALAAGALLAGTPVAFHAGAGGVSLLPAAAFAKSSHAEDTGHRHGSHKSGAGKSRGSDDGKAANKARSGKAGNKAKDDAATAGKPRGRASDDSKADDHGLHEAGDDHGAHHD